MLPEFFVLSLGLLLAVLLVWGFKALPKERWQIIGCLLGGKEPGGVWKGLNLTYYGFFNATAYLLAALVFFLLMGSLSVPAAGIMLILSAILAIGMPASVLIALWVEGKANTFTVGGASFAVLIAALWVVEFINGSLGGRMGFDAPVLSAMAAMSIAYAIGEGIGRLACISFGCCYGKPLSACNPLLRKIFSRRSFIFSGETKKISYAHHLDGREVIPIQGVTAVLLTVNGVAGCYGFLKGFPCGRLLRHAHRYTGLARSLRVLPGGFPGKQQGLRLSGHVPSLHHLRLPDPGPFPVRRDRSAAAGHLYGHDGPLGPCGPSLF